MPNTHHGSALEAALSYYSTIVMVNAEGDSLVSDETLEGLGTTSFLLQALFGSLLRLANPDLAYIPRPLRFSGSETSQSLSRADDTDHAAVAAADMASAVAGAPTQILIDPAIQRPILQYEDTEQSGAQDISELVEEDPQRVKTRLTDLMPVPGYFLAGAVSGGVSRTATAPLDRLKVYLLVNTKTSTTAALAAAKSGRPLVALRNAGRPIADAIVTLWKTGGVRTFFAGKLTLTCRALEQRR
jgi:solute carrier family 25 phosphate transporter 23/24/25/41